MLAQGLQVFDRGLRARDDVSNVGIDIAAVLPVLSGFPAFGAPSGLLLLLLLFRAFSLPFGECGSWLSHFDSLPLLSANAKR